MGDRGQVKIGSVYLYTHWGASELEQTVRDALKRGKDRWSDEEYLARIVFEEMIKGNEMSLTGNGIGTEKHGDLESYGFFELIVPSQTVILPDERRESFAEFTK